MKWEEISTTHWMADGVADTLYEINASTHPAENTYHLLTIKLPTEINLHEHYCTLKDAKKAAQLHEYFIIATVRRTWSDKEFNKRFLTPEELFEQVL